MFARAYSSAIRPITLGRELLGLIDAHNKAEPLNPNFVVNLSAADYEAFTDIEKYLLRELAEAATQYAEQSGIRHNSPISVVLNVSELIKSGDFEIVTEPEMVSPVETSVNSDSKLMATSMISATPPLVDAVLVLANGERIVLDGDTLKIGRQATCRVVFDDSNVSREHAQMRRTSDGWKILDLGSTNGTKINGEKISQEQLLVNGDELAFGTSTAKFEIS